MPKKYQVIKATQRDIPGVYVGGRKKIFSPNGSFETDDAGEAAEIDQVLGAKGTGEVVVTPYNEKEHGHNYRFGGLTSKQARENYDRIFRNPQKRMRRRRRAEVHHGV